MIERLNCSWIVFLIFFGIYYTRTSGIVRSNRFFRIIFCRDKRQILIDCRVLIFDYDSTRFVHNPVYNYNDF